MIADVTVVMPALNREHMIGPALESIRAQTVLPAAVIVVDDGSTDDTAQVARDHGAEVIELQVNGGSGPARNRGIEAATSRWIAFLDSDDVWSPHHLENLMALADQDFALLTAPGIATGGRTIGNASSREQTLSPREALIADLICTSGTMVRKDALVRAGLFRSLRRAQDMDMWVRVLEHGPGLALSQPGFTYRVHDEQAINDEELMRACVDDIIAQYSDREWFRPRDRDLAYTARTWDDARAAQHERRFAKMSGHLRWLARRPHTWRTLMFVLQQRRVARARQRRVVGS